MPTTIVFGAFDRHNLGDLLFAQVAQALLPGDELVFAGLGTRDLRPFGGHAVVALHGLRGDPRLPGARLVHAGGEILTCTARQAAVMLLEPDAVDATLAFLEQHPEAEPAWRRGMLGTEAELPYLAARADLPGIDRIVVAGAGGVAFDGLPEALRATAVARLAAADALTVRDAVTLAHLRDAGLAARLVPDAAVLVEALFGDTVRARATQAPLAAVREAFPGGYAAVQLAAEFGDDATLSDLAAQLEAIASDTGLGIALFRAGAAPWHDDAALLERLAARLPARHVRLFASLHLWDLCALLAQARVFAGSSLHGCIVANAFGIPAVGLEAAAPAQGSKLAAVAASWQAFDTVVMRPPDGLAALVRQAIEGDAQARRERAAQRARAARSAWGELLG